MMNIDNLDWDSYDLVIKEAKEIGKQKSHLYGTKNLVIFDGYGIVVRMNDKIARLNSLFSLWNDKQKEIDYLNCSEDESLDDTLLDLINYSVYLYMYKNKILLKGE